MGGGRHPGDGVQAFMVARPGHIVLTNGLESGGLCRDGGRP
jgi:hypothetical protein